MLIRGLTAHLLLQRNRWCDAVKFKWTFFIIWAVKCLLNQFLHLWITAEEKVIYLTDLKMALVLYLYLLYSHYELSQK